MAWIRPSRAALTFGTANVVVAGLLVAGVFGGLPVRWWVVDVLALILAAALLTASVALTANTRWQSLAVRISAWMVLGAGLALLAALALGASFLYAVSGSLGPQSTQVLTLALALDVPYLLVYPALQLWWLRGEKRDPAQS